MKGFTKEEMKVLKKHFDADSRLKMFVEMADTRRMWFILPPSCLSMRKTPRPKGPFRQP
jgi:hypothetical protein